MGLPVNDANVLGQMQGANGMAAVPATVLPATFNIAPQSEGISSWAYWVLANTAAKGATKSAFVDGRVITLCEITATGVYATLAANLTGAGLSPFLAGKKYLVSAYIWSPVDFWWNPRMCPTAADYGHGAVWVRAGELTRVWYTAVGYAAQNLDLCNSPLAAPGASNGGGIPILAVNNNYSGTMATGAAPFIGGVMVESLPSGYIDGLAMIGDSTLAGSSGGKDRMYDFNTQNNREISTVIGSELRIRVFNRGIGGQRLDQMDARWATDITPLKPWCCASAIIGGINDINQGTRTLAQMQASIQSMTGKSIADGFLYRYYFTVTPTAGMSVDPAKEELRQSYNAWLKATYGSACIDIAALVTDPTTGKDLLGAIYGDGTHYIGAAKTAIGAHIVNTGDWSWRITPSKYVKTVL